MFVGKRDLQRATLWKDLQVVLRELGPRSVEYRMSPGDHNFVGFNKIPTGWIMFSQRYLPVHRARAVINHRARISRVHFPPVFSRAPPPCSCFSNGTPRPSMTPLRRQKILFLPFFIPDLSPTWWFFFVSRIQAQHVECIISSHQSCLVSFRIIWIYYRVKYIYIYI